MKLINIIPIFLFISLPVIAQRKPAKAVPQQRVVAKATENTKLFQQLLPSTAKVMFIDSVVVDKQDFLSQVPLSEETGILSVNSKSKDFANEMGQYENEFGDRRIVADGDSSASRLYTQTLLGDTWSKKTAIADFGVSEYKLQNFPFLCSDGVTLFFSAGGVESMGGRDIFMSTFDSDKAQWYKPQNYGLPFNSTANDYLLAIDDIDSLGWLVTDRRQPAGKVCIYTFVPTETRQNFDDEDISDAQLLSYARLLRIKDTWKFGNRSKALARRDKMLKRISVKRGSTNAMAFVVDDNTVITSASQFHNPQSKQLYKQVTELQQMIKSNEDKLENARLAYHQGDSSKTKVIRSLEAQLPKQRNDLVSLEKKIRSLEKGK